MKSQWGLWGVRLKCGLSGDWGSASEMRSMGLQCIWNVVSVGTGGRGALRFLTQEGCSLSLACVLAPALLCRSDTRRGGTWWCRCLRGKLVWWWTLCRKAASSSDARLPPNSMFNSGVRIWPNVSGVLRFLSLQEEERWGLRGLREGCEAESCKGVPGWFSLSFCA